MVKTRMTFDKLMKQPWYRSIIYLTNEYKEGLQQMHYRYALQENYKPPLHYKEKMQKFFGKSLQKLYDAHRIEKDCIKSTTGLSNFLTKLVEFKLLTQKKDRYGKYVYYTSPLIFSEFDKTKATMKIDCYSPEVVNNIDMLLGYPKTKKHGFKIPYEIFTDGVLFGLDIGIRELLTKEENKELTRCLLNIYDNLIRINNIKFKYKKVSSTVSVFASAYIPALQMPIVKGDKKFMKNISSVMVRM